MLNASRIFERNRRNIIPDDMAWCERACVGAQGRPLSRCPQLLLIFVLISSEAATFFRSDFDRVCHKRLCSLPSLLHLSGVSQEHSDGWHPDTSSNSMYKNVPSRVRTGLFRIIGRRKGRNSMKSLTPNLIVHSWITSLQTPCSQKDIERYLQRSGLHGLVWFSRFQVLSADRQQDFVSPLDNAVQNRNNNWRLEHKCVASNATSYIY